MEVGAGSYQRSSDFPVGCRKDHRGSSMPCPEKNRIDMEDANRSSNARQTSPAFSRSAATSRSAISSGLYLDKSLDTTGLPRKIASMLDEGLVVAGSPVFGSIHGMRRADRNSA